MKILISTDFYTNNLGGVTTSVIALSKGLRSLGNQVKILTLSKDNKSHKNGDEYYIRSFPAYYAPDMRMSVAINDPLLNELTEWHPDIIHVQSEGSALTFASRIRKQCNVALIMTCHTDYAYFVFGRLRNNPVIKAITIIAAWLVYHSAYRIIVPSKKALSFPFLRQFKDRLLVLPNGIDWQKYSLSDEERQEMVNDLNISSDSRLLVCITRLSKEKNIQELIDYMPALVEKVPEAVLLVVGNGPYENRLKALADERGLKDHVVFVGRKLGKDIGPYYALGDIFVSASTFEVHSMSNLEALGQGLPLLCRADEALDGVLEDGVNGFAYRCRQEFVEDACRLLDCDPLLSKMGEESLKKAREFSLKNFASSALKIYEDVISLYRTGDMR